MNDWIQKITELEKELQELKEVNSKIVSRILRLEQNNHDPESKTHRHQSQVRRLNCWEFKKCGRESNGTNVSELGVCPASQIKLDKKHKHINRGKNGGRICWVLVGTLCGGKVQGVHAEKISTCLDCDFYTYVKLQEKQEFRYSLPSKN